VGRKTTPPGVVLPSAAADTDTESDRNAEDIEGGVENMFKIEKVTDEKGRVWIQDPPIAKFLFQSSVAAWLWLVVRVYVGYDFLIAGWHKFTTPAWMDGSGQGIIGFWQSALGTTASGAPVITFDWYRSFIQFLVDSNSAGWFSYVIVFGELAVGVGLILGAFVGVAATGGLLLNMAFMLAGTTSTNPVLAIMGVLLILAWKNAGYIGLDRYVLPLFGTPWKQTKPATAKVKVSAVPAAAAR
jgi:thiosulfate dehydrogenase [quinone] large subunit